MHNCIGFHAELFSAGVSGVQKARLKEDWPLRQSKDDSHPTILDCESYTNNLLFGWKHLKVHIRALEFFARIAFDGQGESCGNALAGHQLSDMIMRFEYCLAFVVHYRDP